MRSGPGAGDTQHRKQSAQPALRAYGVEQSGVLARSVPSVTLFDPAPDLLRSRFEFDFEISTNFGQICLF